MASHQHHDGIRMPRTPDDIIAMTLNIAFHSGDVDFSVETREEDLSAAAEHMAKALSAEPNRSDGLEKAVERINFDRELVKQQTRILQHRSSNALRIDTALEVQRRMLAAGMSNDQLDHILKNKATLYHKIVQLHNLEHLVAKSPQIVNVYLWVKGLNEKIMISFPVKASWEQARLILHNVLLVRDTCTTNELDDSKAVWMYLLHTKNTKGANAIVSVEPLMCDGDYNKMICQLLARNTTLIKRAEYETTVKLPEVKPGLWDDEESVSNDEIVDENGQLYFDREFKANFGKQPKVKRPEPRRSARINNSTNQQNQGTSTSRPKTYFEELDEDLGIP